MNKITLLVFLLFGSLCFGQQLFVEVGKTHSSFDYTNTQGGGLENLQATPHNFMAIGYRNQIFTPKLSVSLGAAFTGYGAIGSDEVLGNYFEWDINYLELGVGFDYALFSIKRASINLKVHQTMGFLMQGSQTFNNSVINLKNNDDFNNTPYDSRIGFGFSHPISETLSFYLNYMYGKTWSQDDSTTIASAEKLRIVNHNIGFGFIIDISPREITTKSN